jgi:glycosyltransferase involved in cell wall biosynthesis
VTRCPSLDELPPPPAGRHGWPWTEQSPRLPDAAPDGRPWPRISVVTASLNQAPYIEETIRSVLLQGYPDVEHIVIDGGSTDGTLEILDRYGRWLAPWVSEPDRGAPDAVNKGFARATGTLLAALSSDDIYLPGALRRFADAHAGRPEAFILGDIQAVEGDGERVVPSWIGHQFNVTFRNAVDPLGETWFWHGAGLCVPRELFLAVGPYDETIRTCCDVDWLCRLTRVAEPIYVPEPVCRFRVHAEATSVVNRVAQLREAIEVVQRYWPLVPGLDRRHMRALYAVHEAAFHLAHNATTAEYWNRWRGVSELVRAVATSPRIVGLPRFRSLVRRALLPRPWLRSNPWRDARAG